jgi:DUF971 family protein
MSDPTLSFTRIQRVWEPYVHAEVKQCLTQVRREFGMDKRRWQFRGDGGHSRYTVNFYFRDPHDAMIFALKYLS